MTKRLGIGPFDESMAETAAPKFIQDLTHLQNFMTKIGQKMKAEQKDK
jgi:hypothetical protein